MSDEKQDAAAAVKPGDATTDAQSTTKAALEAGTQQPGGRTAFEVVDVRKGLFGVHGSGDTSGYGGLVSFGHGAFLGVSAYTMALLWNFQGLSPWIGVPAGVALAAAAGALLGYPCFRLRVVGHYFALVTLAAGEIVRILVTALREDRGHGGRVDVAIGGAEPRE